MRLVLFDIDGTLLSCGSQVRGLFAAGLEEVFATPGPIGEFDFAGKTDPQIVFELMAAAGVPEPRVRREMPRVREAFRRRLAAGLRREGMRLMPAVDELLGRLAARGDLHLGLLTGNWEATGRIKLSRFGLNDFFAFGAFGDDAVDRRDLVPAALERAARATGKRFSAAETLIVGDTLHDVACGHAHGAATLAVATGGTPVETLAAAGADWVAPDLAHAAEMVPALAG